VVDESPDTRLTPAGELLVKVDELAHRTEGVVVCALGSSCLTKHVCQKGGVAGLLDSHEGNVRAVLSSEASVEEILLGEDRKTVVEQVKLDPFLVETELNRLVVEVTVHLVTRLGAVGAETTSWRVRNRHGVLR